MYKYFYTDYCEEKAIDGSKPWDADVRQIAHSMDCVLYRPDNFLGIVNSKNQTLQFYVEKDLSITIDVPIVKGGEYIGSKKKKADLETCLQLVRNLNGTEDFLGLLQDS
jgi:hypothetical protein